MPVSLSSSIEMIDTLQFGLPCIGAAYHIHGKRHALIDTGTSHAATRIRERLGSHAPDFIFLTHVHPDHAGASAMLAEAYPEAVIGVHERGVRHLVDPVRINESVRASTGPLADLYGEMFPIPVERIVVLKGGERFDLGKGMRIEVIDTPGHAPHHLCFFERSHRALFCGDALGIWRREMHVPATVPPSFDSEQSLATIKRLAEYQPEYLYLSHFGEVRDAATYIDRYDLLLREWVGRISELHRSFSDEEVIRKVLSAPKFQGLEEPLFLELKMCVLGVLHYLEQEAT
ncbi:MBL fold metallo-hydrolase [Candidatus Bipolaricaulota bacterium]|nr:MBL fold metallo-hydrolase [Candidatus Bipolaricaulota bacterium]